MRVPKSTVSMAPAAKTLLTAQVSGRQPVVFVLTPPPPPSPLCTLVIPHLHVCALPGAVPGWVVPSWVQAHTHPPPLGRDPPTTVTPRGHSLQKCIQIGAPQGRKDAESCTSTVG